MSEYTNRRHVPYLVKSDAEKFELDNFPSFCASGSIRGMRKLYYGKDALLVRSGRYIYNVSKNEEIWLRACRLEDFRKKWKQ